MKTVQTVFALLLLAAITAAAQTTCAPHPSDPAAVLLAQFTVSIELQQSVSGKTGKKGTKCTSEQLICVWRTSNGGTDLIGDAGSIKMNGSCTDDLAPADVLAQLGHAAIVKAVGLGLVKCSTKDDGTTAARYLTANCVTKSGSGSRASFSPCTTVQCVRAYSAYCPTGSNAPVVKRTAADNESCMATSSDCQTGCDQDCPPSSGSIVQ